MKKLFLLFFAITMFSCDKETENAEPENMLIGTKWSTFSFKSTAGQEDVYKILRFLNETEVEDYSATEKTRVIGDIDILKYTYNHPNLTIIRENGYTSTGEVFDTFIRVDGSDYTKE